MQTKLRVTAVVVVASLLWTSPTSAATHRAKVQKKVVKYVGMASWYGARHQGRKMANGQRFDSRKLTAASWNFPLGAKLRVVNIKNGRSVVVTITDRGPNVRLHRLIDLSEAAARNLDYVDEGLTRVVLYPVVTMNTETFTFNSSLLKSDQEKKNGTASTSTLDAQM